MATKKPQPKKTVKKTVKAKINPVTDNAVIIPIGKYPQYQTKMEQLLELKKQAHNEYLSACEVVKQYGNFLRQELAKV